jgi:hypothetical protein
MLARSEILDCVRSERYLPNQSPCFYAPTRAGISLTIKSKSCVRIAGGKKLRQIGSYKVGFCSLRELNASFTLKAT